MPPAAARGAEESVLGRYAAVILRDRLPLRAGVRAPGGAEPLTSSTRVFHWPHAVHWPDHLAWTEPQDWQT